MASSNITDLLATILKKKNPTPDELANVRSILNAIVTGPPGAGSLPLPQSIGAKPAEELAFTAHWLQSHPNLTPEFKAALPAGKSYGGATKPANVTKGGTAVPKPTPTEAPLIEEAASAGRTPFGGLSPASIKASAGLQAELNRQALEDQVMQQFAQEKYGVGTWIPGARAGAARTTLTKPGPAVQWTTPISELPPLPATVGVGSPLNIGGQNVMAGDLAKSLMAQATGQVENAAAATPGAIASTASDIPFIASSARGPQTLEQYLASGARSAAGELPELSVAAHTPASLEAAIAAQAVPEAEAAARAGLASRLLNPSTIGGKTIAGLGYGIGGQLAGGVIKNMGTNPQGETSDAARYLAAAARGAGTGAAIGVALPGGPITTGLGALIGGGIGAGWEALFGHPSVPFTDKQAALLNQINSSIPTSLDPTIRNNILQGYQLQVQFAQTPDDLKKIYAALPQDVMAGLAQTQHDQQTQARLAAVQAGLAPLLSKIYDTSQSATNQAYTAGMAAANALTDPTLAALTRSRAESDRSFANQQSQANLTSLATYPAAQSLDFFNALNDQTKASLTGQMAARLAAQYLPSKSSSGQSLTAFAG